MLQNALRNFWTYSEKYNEVFYEVLISNSNYFNSNVN